MSMGVYGLRRRSLIVSAAALAAPALRAADFPSRPIRLVVPFSAGGTTDVMARALQEQMTGRLGQPVLVDNRPGAYGTIAAQDVARSAPDGCTLLFGNNGLMTVTPTLQTNAGFMPLESFAPVALVSTTPFLLAVHPSVPAGNLRELVAYGRTRPAGMNFSCAGGIIDLTTEMLARSGNMKIQRIPYKGVAGATNAIVGGEVDGMVVTPSPLLNGFFQAGRLKLVGVFSAEPSPLYPEADPIARALPMLDISIWFGIFAPARTAPAVVDRLGGVLGEALALPDVKRSFIEAGATPKYEPPTSVTRRMREELARWTPLASSVRGT